jgi:sporulation protein YlmC with PRC-barrel domain
MFDRRHFLGAALAANAALAGAPLFADDDAKDDASEPESRPHFRAKQILGAKVTIDEDKSVGKVDDIVIDENGNVDYLIVAKQDGKLVTIPWDAAQFNAKQRLATVDITPQQFQEVPVYTTENYPTFSAPAYRTQTYQLFGLTPGLQRRLIRRGGTVIRR